MSNLIPIVPSSPPPIDDEWEDGDDFGDFLSADDKTNTSEITHEKNILPKVNSDRLSNVESIENKSSQNIDSSISASNHDPEFANFNSFPLAQEKNSEENWAQFNSNETKHSCNSKEYSNQISDSQSEEHSNAVCDNHSNHSCSDSNDNVENNNSYSETVPANVKNSISNGTSITGSHKTDQHDATSQGSLTDSGMYSNDVSPAPNIVPAIPDFSNCNGDKQCSREQSICSEYSEQQLSKNQSVDVCSENTSHCSFEGKSEENLQSCSAETASSIGSNNEDFELHEEHEVSPEPLSFKPASFTEEEGVYFENQDFNDENVSYGGLYQNEFHQDNVANNNDTPELQSCNNGDGSLQLKTNDTDKDTVKNDENHESDITLSASCQEDHSCYVEKPATFQGTEKSSNNTENLGAKVSTNSEKSVVPSLNSNSAVDREDNDIHSVQINEEILPDTVCDSNNKQEGEQIEIFEIKEEKVVGNTLNESKLDSVHDGDDSNKENISCVQQHPDATVNSIDKSEVDVNGESEDEFGDFTDIRNNQSDDFDGFAAFDHGGSAEVAEDSGGWAAFSENNTGVVKEDNDWAAFSATAVEVKESRNEQEEEHQDDDHSFGDFDEAKQDDLEDDDFGGFSSHAETSGDINKQSKPDKKLDISGALNCFSMPNLDKNANIEDKTEHLLALVSRKESVQREVISKQPGQFRETKSIVEVDMNIWSHLKEMENTQGLKFQWTNSNANQMLLKAINIDTRNMLIGHKKPAVPIFASGLGLLEPRSGPIEPVLMSHQGTSDRTPSAIIDTSKTCAPTSGNPTQDLPPVDFDWKNSGLTNPLDAQEKERAILQALEPSQEKRGKPVQPLENILANMKFTSTLSSSMQPCITEKKLSSKANDVVLQLPDFSFMKARVLMFPIKRISTVDSTASLNEIGIKSEENVTNTQVKDDISQEEEIVEMF